MLKTKKFKIDSPKKLYKPQNWKPGPANKKISNPNKPFFRESNQINLKTPVERFQNVPKIGINHPFYWTGPLQS
jgi:hypothetical protein